MNPSGAGWINKFGSLVKNELDVFTDYRDLYNGLKKTGFVYGINTQVPRFIVAEHRLSEDEKAKINLLVALYFTYRIETGNADFNAFADKVLAFYNE
ncbi:MAG: hypothetical protein WBM83_15755, partial [Flavobacteriaceae bacterium]